jgi:hypothetical protein
MVQFLEDIFEEEDVRVPIRENFRISQMIAK